MKGFFISNDIVVCQSELVEDDLFDIIHFDKLSVTIIGFRFKILIIYPNFVSQQRLDTI